MSKPSAPLIPTLDDVLDNVIVASPNGAIQAFRGAWLSNGQFDPKAFLNGLRRACLMMKDREEGMLARDILENWIARRLPQQTEEVAEEFKEMVRAAALCSSIGSLEKSFEDPDVPVGKRTQEEVNEASQRGVDSLKAMLDAQVFKKQVDGPCPDDLDPEP